MTVVEKEVEEDGDGDLTCSVAKVEELFSSFQLSSKGHEVVVFKDNGDTVCNMANNAIKIERGLGPEIMVSEQPAGWMPD
jgi:hypothetical protein